MSRKFLGRFEVESFKPENPAKNSKFSLDFQWKIRKIDFFEKFEKSKIWKFPLIFFEKSRFFRFLIFSKISIFLIFHWKFNENFGVFAGFSGLKDSTSNRPKKNSRHTYTDSFFLWTRTNINIQLPEKSSLWWISATQAHLALREPTYWGSCVRPSNSQRGDHSERVQKSEPGTKPLNTCWKHVPDTFQVL